MLVLVLLAEIVLAVFLMGVLLIAVLVTMNHGDPTATYQLYAIRDKLIDASVFGGIPRNNPWLEALYENVNSVLLHSNMLGGPERWSLAVAVGRYQASHPNSGKKLQPFPQDAEECPDEIRALVPELRNGLEHLARNHIGIYLQTNAQERWQRRIQREKAKNLLKMMREDDRCGCAV